MSEQTQGRTELTIGRLAKAAGVNVETVRYYQKIALINEPRKPAQGFRHYPQQTLEQIKFIKRAQKLGFSLQEIADLFELGAGNCRDVRLRAEEKHAKIGKQIKDLQVLQSSLMDLINACNVGQGKQACPLVENLLADD